MEGAWKDVMRQKITVKLPECGNDATRERFVVRSLSNKGDPSSNFREFG